MASGLWNGVVLHYPLIGGEAQDMSGNGNNGTLSGTPTALPTGLVGQNEHLTSLTLVTSTLL